jgi:hypothetical protein
MINLKNLAVQIIEQAYLQVMTVYPLVFVGGENFEVVDQRLNKAGYLCYRKVRVKKHIVDYYYRLWGSKPDRVVRVYAPENKCILIYSI